MSLEHPIIAVTGSSGAGTSTVRSAFEHIFNRLHLKAVYVEGDSFHRYDREEMKNVVQRALVRGETFSHYSPAANHLDRLEALFREYSQHGTGEIRRYLHTEDEALPYGQHAGSFTPWTPIPEGTDVLFYEGLHGGVVTDRVDVAQYVDLLVGVAPAINLEWIQKIHRDTGERGYSREDVTKMILLRMSDYINYITPQFSRTDINFQRIPLVDTSNPFIARDVPTPDESLVIIRFRRPRRLKVEFPFLLSMLHGSFMTRPNTLCIPGGKMPMAMEIILRPLIEDIARKRRKMRRAAKGKDNSKDNGAS
ncbi:MAG TPA: phosphoribulokinase [Nevskiales bacterium]|nr:phosphoribulokinase [Nevskiales bacterium]